MKTPETLLVGTLGIEWHALGDRAGHRIIRMVDGETFPLLESVEDTTANERWPASPPLFDWHCEQRAGATVLFGVGLAGKSHWSAALSAEPGVATTKNRADSRAAARISFDIACRAGEAPRLLGSSYRCLGQVQQLGEFEIDLGGGCSLSVDTETTVLRLAGDKLILEPLSMAAEAWPHTFRWRYTMRTSPETAAR